MRRSSSIVLALFLVAGIAGGGAAAASAKAAAPKPTLQLLHTRHYGNVLVNGDGYMVYGFSIDKPRKDACFAIATCISIWPEVLAPRTLRLGRGVKRSLVGSIRLPDGTRQLTYNRWPLYTYFSDDHKGQVSNINLFQYGGFWPAVSAAGKFVPAS